MAAIVLAAAERMLNALLEESTPAREQVRALDGKTLSIRLVGPELAIEVRSGGDRLIVERAALGDADATLEGTPFALAQAWRRGKEGMIGDSTVRVGGDTDVLERFVSLFEQLTPDFEDTVARLTGDVFAHEAVRLADALRSWGHHAASALVLNTGEYLQEERRDLPPRLEVEAFYRDVETLRDDVDRLLVRADRARTAAGGAKRATGG
jgi:ubiquinone biosynthesis protein UbiJ